MYIDTHTHLYDPQLTIDPQHIQRAIEAGVHTMYMPNCDSETIEPMLAVADSFPQNCLPMMGLHPCYVKENYKWELEQVALHLSKRKYYGIGEVGLDYHWDLTYVEQQKDALRTQIGYARQYGLPVILHSRKSTADCIKLIKEQQDGSLTGIFHCFSGSFEEAKEIIKLGFYLGIGGVVTYKNSGLNS
ncbi:MAG: TatD family deoxyribonuclease, partial [Chitinophagia bacterium]|nr:TatD family deoxyribonuclease [Chitinophagia bacterium]